MSEEKSDSFEMTTSSGNETEAGFLEDLNEAGDKRKVPALTVISESGAINEVIVDKHQYYLGRSNECELQIKQSNASRFHAFIIYENIGEVEEEPVCVLEDNESRNGTFLNGKLLKRPIRLIHGDRFLIGNTVITYLVRQGWEVESDQEINKVINQYEGENALGRIPCDLDASVKILVPDETFTPFSIEGKIKDINSGGVRLVTTTVEKDLWLLFVRKKLYIKAEIHFQNIDITVNGRLAWSHYDSNTEPPTCIIGIEFQSMDSEHQKKLHDALLNIGIDLSQESVKPGG